MWSLKSIGGGLLGLLLGLSLPVVALSSDKEVYDGPEVEQSGRTIHAKVVKIDKQDKGTGRCDVSVENLQTGEVVQVHLDKSTERERQSTEPSPGDLVVVKYDENSKHALTFCKRHIERGTSSIMELSNKPKNVEGLGDHPIQARCGACVSRTLTSYLIACGNDS